MAVRFRPLPCHREITNVRCPNGKFSGRPVAAFQSTTAAMLVAALLARSANRLPSWPTNTCWASLARALTLTPTSSTDGAPQCFAAMRFATPDDGSVGSTASTLLPASLSSQPRYTWSLSDAIAMGLPCSPPQDPVPFSVRQDGLPAFMSVVTSRCPIAPRLRYLTV